MTEERYVVQEPKDFFERQEHELERWADEKLDLLWSQDSFKNFGRELKKRLGTASPKIADFSRWLDEREERNAVEDLRKLISNMWQGRPEGIALIKVLNLFSEVRQDNIDFYKFQLGVEEVIKRLQEEESIIEGNLVDIQEDILGEVNKELDETVRENNDNVAIDVFLEQKYTEYNEKYAQSIKGFVEEWLNTVSGYNQFKNFLRNRIQAADTNFFIDLMSPSKNAVDEKYQAAAENLKIFLDEKESEDFDLYKIVVMIDSIAVRIKALEIDTQQSQIANIQQKAQSFKELLDMFLGDDLVVESKEELKRERKVRDRNILRRAVTSTGFSVPIRDPIENTDEFSLEVTKELNSFIGADVCLFKDTPVRVLKGLLQEAQSIEGDEERLSKMLLSDKEKIQASLDFYSQIVDSSYKEQVNELFSQVNPDEKVLVRLVNQVFYGLAESMFDLGGIEELYNSDDVVNRRVYIVGKILEERLMQICLDTKIREKRGWDFDVTQAPESDYDEAMVASTLGIREHGQTTKYFTKNVVKPVLGTNDVFADVLADLEKTQESLTAILDLWKSTGEAEFHHLLAGGELFEVYAEHLAQALAIADENSINLSAKLRGQLLRYSRTYTQKTSGKPKKDRKKQKRQRHGNKKGKRK